MARRSFVRALSWLLGWIAVLWVAAVVYRQTLADHVASGQCEGIGFGCVPSPRDGMTLFMIILGLPITAGALVIGLPWILAWHRRWPSWVVGSSAFVFGAAVALLILAVLGVFS